MKCPECDNAILKSSKENYLYVESGLRNITLKDILIRYCPTCGARFASIPRITELHRLIALALINKPGRLVPSEIRFLRKSLGWSGADFARKFHCSPQQVSRWESENSNSRMSMSNELLLRLFVADGQKIEDYQENIEQVAVEDVFHPVVLEMQDQKGEWSETAVERISAA